MTIEIDSDFARRVQVTFSTLPPGAFPAPVSLADYLTNNAPIEELPADLAVPPNIAGMFMSASVEMWHRSVHSLLYSAALTNYSPVWSVVSGYYASHYSIRAIAHLLGYFQLFSIKKTVQLSWQNGGHVCKFTKKGRGGGDHRFYWKQVKLYPYFAADDLFTMNIETNRISDSSHRGRANYGDHLNQFRPFGMPDHEELVARIKQISTISFTAPPIPDRDRYPDVDNVQVVAYHRIVRYRRLLDEILGADSTFWTRHRNPQWCESIIDFQLVEQDNLGTL